MEKINLTRLRSVTFVSEHKNVLQRGGKQRKWSHGRFLRKHAWMSETPLSPQQVLDISLYDSDLHSCLGDTYDASLLLPYSIALFSRLTLGSRGWVLAWTPLRTPPASNHPTRPMMKLLSACSWVCKIMWPTTYIGPGIWVTACLEELPHAFRVAIVGGNQQWRGIKLRGRK